MSAKNSKIGFATSLAVGSGMLLFGAAIIQPLVALGGLGIVLVSWANLRRVVQKSKKLNAVLTV